MTARQSCDGKSSERKQFRHAAQFGAWIGLVPRQHSSGGKNHLGGITKRGDTYLRSLLIQGAKSAVMTPTNAAIRSPCGSQPCASVRVGKKPPWRWPTDERASCGR